MEENRKPSLSRQASFSRRNSLVAPMVGFARMKKLLCIGVFFAAGILCGHIITQMVRQPSYISSARLPRGDNLHPAAQRAAMIAKAEQSAEKEHSRRKDLSVQFRDYVPRFIFINCGGTFPKSVELFLDTYPSSEKYVIFSFIPDESYAPLYSAYQSHKIMSPVLCAGQNGSQQFELKSLTGELKNVSVPTLDIAQWILDNIHADEHIVLKVDEPEDVEKGIADKLTETSVIEWINKFYTTSNSTEIVDHYYKQFSIRRQTIEIWDDIEGTFSDYDKLNPTRIPPSSKAIIKECGNAKLNQYPLFLYASRTTLVLNKTLTLLHYLADFTNKRLNVAVFLPFSYLKANRFYLEALYTRMDVGVYFNTSVTDTENDLRYNQIRNRLVGAENSFGSVGLILQYVLVGRGVNSSLVERLVDDRKYITFVKTLEILPNSSDLSLKIDMPEIEDYEIPVLDISRPGSMTSVLFLLERYRDHIIPLTECLKYSSKAS